MYQAVIIYAPEQAGVERLAAEIRAHCGRKKVKVQTKAAAEARIPDLAAADLIFIGSDVHQGSPVHADFDELQRSLAGVNLAPRVAGLFTSTEKQSLEALRTMLADADIDMSVPFPAAGDSAALTGWLDALFHRLGEKKRDA
jgi:flavodoxin